MAHRGVLWLGTLALVCLFRMSVLAADSSNAVKAWIGGSSDGPGQEDAGDEIFARQLHETTAQIKHTHKPLTRAISNFNCNATAQSDNLVVVAGSNYDPTWLDELGLPYIRYQYTDAQQPHFYVNSANEAGAYIQFIADYYDCLPKAVAFIHGHDGEGWHNYDMKETLQNIKWDNITKYIDINVKPGTWEVRLGDALPTPKNPIAYGLDVYNGSFNPHQVIRGIAYELWEAHLWLMADAYSRVYDMHLGPQGVGPMPGKLRFTCCAQFVVPREGMHQRTRAFYQSTLQYLGGNDLRGNTHVDKKYVIGDAMSIYWGLIFGAADITPMQPCSEYSKDETPARCVLKAERDAAA